MQKPTYLATIVVLLCLPSLIILWRSIYTDHSTQNLLPEKKYQVQFQFELQDTSNQELFVKAYLPQSNAHQRITNAQSAGSDMSCKTEYSTAGKRAIWRSESQSGKWSFVHQFMYAGKAMRYHLDEDIPSQQWILDTIAPYLAPSALIQSDHADIKRLLQVLVYEENNLKSTVKAIFDYVYAIPSVQSSETMDALSAFHQQAASCNGKGRLFVALCRAAGIPARTVGGIILEQTQKKTSHQWTEIYTQGHWVPFDPLNGHFAYLPARYMQLYWGDHFLLAHTPDIDFDYNFHIESVSDYIQADQKETNLWGLLAFVEMPLLRVILVLPFCALLVGLLRNVVGLKTFGVFLPAIMAVSLFEVGFWYGLLAFSSVVLVISVINFPLEKWGMLYTPKLVIILTAVVITLLGVAYLGHSWQVQKMQAVLFFPIIIMTILAERFAKNIMEEGYESAFKLMGQTLLVTFLCYQILSADFLPALLLTYPEVYAFLLAILLLLGRWIGLRLTEYQRFRLI